MIFLNNQFSEQETTRALNITVSQSIIFTGELVCVYACLQSSS